MKTFVAYTMLVCLLLRNAVYYGGFTVHYLSKCIIVFKPKKSLHSSYDISEHVVHYVVEKSDTFNLTCESLSDVLMKSDTEVMSGVENSV